MATEPHDAAEPVSVFLSFDNPFAVAAAALIGSILRSKTPETRIDFYVSDVGLSRRSRRRIEGITAARTEVGLRWLHLDTALRRRLRRMYLKAETLYPPAAYSRLVIDDLLPSHLRKVIYLDVDTLLRHDIGDLWAAPMEGKTLLGVVDPLIASAGSLAACGLPGTPADPGRRYTDFLADQLVARGEREAAELARVAPYINSGVLVIDLERYRSEGCARRLMRVAEDVPNLRFPDQDALNIVLQDRIGTLDPRWNVTAALDRLGREGKSPYDQAVHATLTADPWIVHFTQRPKPWNPGCTSPFLAEWHRALEGSAWQSWRATRLTESLARVPKGYRIAMKRAWRALQTGRAA